MIKALQPRRWRAASIHKKGLLLSTNKHYFPNPMPLLEPRARIRFQPDY
jgi:hypothetical protein